MLLPIGYRTYQLLIFMKTKLLFIAVFTFFALNASAQTAAELIGKWKLVKWTKNGNEKDIMKEFKTTEVYQVFDEDGKFISVVGDEERKSKWKLSDDNKKLTIRSGIITVPFSVDYFDAKKRVITTDAMGTLEYEKVN